MPDRQPYTLFQTTYTDRQSGEQRASDTWHIRFRDHLNRRQKLAGTPRERDTIAMAEKVMELVRCRQSGHPLDSKTVKWLETQPEKLVKRLAEMDVIDPVAAAIETTLLEHLEGKKDAEDKLIEPGYRHKLLSKGDTEQHVNQQINRIRDLIDKCEFIHFRDMMRPGAATRVADWLNGQRTKGEINGSTFNAYVRAVKGFCRWLAKEGKAPVMALASLEPVENVEQDSKPRRELSIEEVRWLIDTAKNSTTQRLGLSGADRALAYEFSFLTGIRPGQMRKLTVADFNLKDDPPTVKSKAANVKRRRAHVQVIHSSLAGRLRTLFEPKVPTAAAFTLPSKYNMARMLRADLADARAKWIAKAADDKDRIERQKGFFLADKDGQGNKVDFYSIRHGHGTALADSGVAERDISASMHHTNRQTTARYIHASKRTLKQAIESLPTLSYPLAPTGTDGNPAAAGSAGRLSTACPTGTPTMDSHGQISQSASVTETAELPGDIDISRKTSRSEHVAQLVEQRTFNPQRTPQEPPENPTNQHGPDPRLSNACPDPASDPTLAELVSLWPKLSPKERNQLLALARSM